ncbi:MAG TPA: glycosyltransferase [Thermoleophilaceae bacterium]
MTADLHHDRGTPPYVLLVCSGLDHAARGFESFARDCFDAFRGDARLELELIKGSGPSGPGERALPTLRRDWAACRALSRLTGIRAFRYEHLSFGLSLQPVLLHRRPDVVFLSEWDTARALAAMRRLTRQRFKLLLSNGTFMSRGFDHLDHVQELTPAARDYVIQRGADPRRHTVLPLGFDIRPDFAPTSDEQRRALRERLRLPLDRAIVLSVAALNRYHKRLDYLIEEIAAIPAPRPFLLMLGQEEEETAQLRALARDRLGESGHAFRTVPAEEVADHCRASDVFVLASLAEMQGRALIESMATGLPTIAHDYSVSRFALGPEGIYADLSRRGRLAPLLAEPVAYSSDPVRACARHRYVYENFSWDRLRPRYVELFAAVANSTVSSSTAE